MSNVQNTTEKQIEILDVLRGLAVLLVLKSHILYFDTKYFGWFEVYFIRYMNIEQHLLFSNRYMHPGVLIFIVLSGFIIHYTNSTAPKLADISWSLKFIFKRIARLFPVLFMGMIAGLLVQHFFYKDLNGHDLNSFFENSLFLYGVKYIEPPVLNNILVTVESEFWLYLFYAFVFKFFTNSKFWSLVFFFSVLIWILNFRYNINMVTRGTSNEDIWSRNNFYAYLVYWLVGALAAEISKNKKNIQISWFLPIAIFSTMMAIIPFQKALWSVLVNEFMMAVAVATLLIKIVAIKPYRLINLTIGAVGRAGYSIYGFHMCLIMLFTSSSFQLVSPYWFSPAFVLVYTLGISFCIYFVFERPIHLKTKLIFKKY